MPLHVQVGLAGCVLLDAVARHAGPASTACRMECTHRRRRRSPSTRPGQVHLPAHAVACRRTLCRWRAPRSPDRRLGRWQQVCQRPVGHAARQASTRASPVRWTSRPTWASGAGRRTAYLPPAVPNSDHADCIPRAEAYAAVRTMSRMTPPLRLLAGRKDTLDAPVGDQPDERHQRVEGAGQPRRHERRGDGHDVDASATTLPLRSRPMALASSEPSPWLAMIRRCRTK